MQQCKIKLFLLLCIFIITYSCKYQKYSHGIKIDENADNYKNILNQYPQEFKVHHRIVLNINKKQYDFIGYIHINQKKGFRAVGYGEMAGKLFEFIYSDGLKKIIAKPGKMPDKPLLEGAIEDIKDLYLPQILEKPYLENKTDNSIALISGNDINFTEHLFSSFDAKYISKSIIKKNKILKTFEFPEYKKFPFADFMLPSKIIVNNRRWFYKRR